VSGRPSTKIFGMKIGVDPKILAGVLIALAVVIFWYNTRSDDDSAPTSPVARHDAAEPIPAARPVTVIARSRRGQSANDRGTLRLRPIDPTRGDVDPTLRLDLLARLQNVQLASAGRSLFEVGPAPLTAAEKDLLAHPPKVTPHVPTPPMPPLGPTIATEQPLNIPLKYYGFVKSAQKNQGNEGLFLDGDNVVVGSEGELVMKKYLVVALTPTSARLEDPQLKKGQTLPVVPAATP
jgi:hypothetical protein